MTDRDPRIEVVSNVLGQCERDLKPGVRFHSPTEQACRTYTARNILIALDAYGREREDEEPILAASQSWRSYAREEKLPGTHDDPEGKERLEAEEAANRARKLLEQRERMLCEREIAFLDAEAENAKLRERIIQLERDQVEYAREHPLTIQEGKSLVAEASEAHALRAEREEDIKQIRERVEELEKGMRAVLDRVLNVARAWGLPTTTVLPCEPEGESEQPKPAVQVHDRESESGSKEQPGEFVIVWREGAYRVSVPNLLEEGERLRVIPVECVPLQQEIIEEGKMAAAQALCAHRGKQWGAAARVSNVGIETWGDRCMADVELVLHAALGQQEGQ